MPRSSLPDGAVRVAAPTRRCLVCASRGHYQADYDLKYVFAGGVYHADCHAESLLFDMPFDDGGDCVDALLGSGLQSDNNSLCDAHVAVWVG